MENMATLLIGVGGLFLLLFLVLAVVELAFLRTIRPPRRKNFAFIRLNATQYQTIFAPALGALISGLFVSISAAFFYEGFTGGQDSADVQAGSWVFITGMIVLVITLRLLLKDAGEPAELVREPFSIRAAANESAENPRKKSKDIDPDFLDEQLKNWLEHASARSMNVSVNKKSTRLDQTLGRAAEAKNFWSATLLSLEVYFVALRVFPSRFIWSLLSFALFMVGVLWFAVFESGLNFLTSWRPWTAVIVLLCGSAAISVLYCAARGNRARLWHKVNLIGLKEARVAIEEAKEARASVRSQDEMLSRVIQRADRFLSRKRRVSDSNAHLLFNVGRIQLSLRKM
ncbi:hypothetical protein [Arthrobacter citreus]|uniref:hypothetical protein n=1 Tax=Arthrobacter citreus TaxID=1670 RepID=UPI0036DEA294